ncbi:RNA exonuclease 1 homolog isoform X1 [Drosophila ficusphila]|uniref:RNA exonuclease 1 homolog isoform X1 n=1 Tax=Drosophila ficusphila TaxID=30025 RepID=UPI001C88F1B5|nr:RNA exonuclease 1 homolog isoform X1 [Drosophila ficusphila]
MLPSTGLFKGFLCPYFDSNDESACRRPFCHFKHARKDDVEAAPTAEPASVPEYKPAPKLLSLPLPQITLSAPKKKSNLEYHPEKPGLNASPAKKKQEATVDLAPKYVPGQPSATNGDGTDDWQADLDREIDEQMQVEIEEPDQGDLGDEEIHQNVKVEQDEQEEQQEPEEQPTSARRTHKRDHKSSKERERDKEKEKEKFRDRDKEKKDKDKDRDKYKDKEKDKDKKDKEKGKRKSSHTDKERSKERHTSSSSKHKSSSSSSSKKSSSTDKHRDEKSSSRHKSSSSSTTSKSNHHKSSSSSSRSKSKSSSSSSNATGPSKSEPEAEKETEAAAAPPDHIDDYQDDLDFDFEMDTSEGEIVRQCEMIFDEMEKKFAQMHKDDNNEGNPETSRKRKAPSPDIDTLTEAATAALQKRRVAHENADKIKPHLAPSVAIRKPNHVRNAMQAIFERRAELRRQEKLQAEAAAEQLRQAQERVRQAQEELRLAKVNSNLTPLIPRSALTPPVRSARSIAPVANIVAIARAKKKIEELQAEKKPAFTPAQSFKGAGRVAHKPTVALDKAAPVANDASAEKPTVLEPSSSKISYNVRIQYYEMMVKHCTVIYPQLADAWERAQVEELAVFKKCNTPAIYKNSCMLAINKLRKEAIEAGNRPSVASKTVSHEMMLGGKRALTTSWSVEKKKN